MTIRDTELVIVSDEFVVLNSRSRPGVAGHPRGLVSGTVTGAISGRHHGCRFIVNDDVQFRQTKGPCMYWTLTTSSARPKSCGRSA
jgi:hypothetical protein